MFYGYFKFPRWLKYDIHSLNENWRTMKQIGFFNEQIWKKSEI